MGTPVLSSLIAHIIGIPVVCWIYDYRLGHSRLQGVVSAVGVYQLFNEAYDIGVSPSAPAPAAQTWKAIAELLANGLDQLPPHSGGSPTLQHQS